MIKPSSPVAYIASSPELVVLEQPTRLELQEFAYTRSASGSGSGAGSGSGLGSGSGTRQKQDRTRALDIPPGVNTGFVSARALAATFENEGSKDAASGGASLATPVDEERRNDTVHKRRGKRKSEEGPAVEKTRKADQSMREPGIKRRKSSDSDKENTCVPEHSTGLARISTSTPISISKATARPSTRLSPSSSTSNAINKPEPKPRPNLRATASKTSSSSTSKPARRTPEYTLCDQPQTQMQTRMTPQITKPNISTKAPSSSHTKDAKPVFKLPPPLTPSPPRFKRPIAASPHRFKLGGKKEGAREKKVEDVDVDVVAESADRNQDSTTRREQLNDEHEREVVILSSSQESPAEVDVAAALARDVEAVAEKEAQQRDCAHAHISDDMAKLDSALPLETRHGRETLEPLPGIGQPIDLDDVPLMERAKTSLAASIAARSSPRKSTECPLTKEAQDVGKESREHRVPTDTMSAEAGKPIQTMDITVSTTTTTTVSSNPVPSPHPRTQPRPIPKHLRTVTGAAIAHYGLDNPPPDQTLPAPSSASEFFQPRPYDAKELLTGEIFSPVSTSKAKKTSRRKQPPPPAKLLDAEQMARRMQRQDERLLFGTSSQLAGSPSPRTYRDLQRALRESELECNSGSDADAGGNLSAVASKSTSATAFTARLRGATTGTRSLWREATRDEQNGVYTPPPRSPRIHADLDDAGIDSDDSLEIRLDNPLSRERSGSTSTLRLAKGSERKKKRLLCAEEFVPPMATPFSNQQRACSTSRSPEKSRVSALTSVSASDLISPASKDKTIAAPKARKKNAVPKEAAGPKRPRGRPKKSATEADAEDKIQAKEQGQDEAKSKHPTGASRKRSTKKQATDPGPGTMERAAAEIQLIGDMDTPTPSPPRVRSLLDFRETLVSSEMDPLAAVNSRAAYIAAKANSTTREMNAAPANLTEEDKKRRKRDEEMLKRAEQKRRQGEQANILFPQITRAVEAQPRSKNAQVTLDCWYEKMLMYEPIILEDFTAWLNGGALHDLGGRTDEEDETMQEQLGVGEKGAMRLGDRGFVKDKNGVREIQEGRGLRGRLMTWVVQKWCEENSVCAVFRDGVWAGNRKRRGL